MELIALLMAAVLAAKPSRVRSQMRTRKSALKGSVTPSMSALILRSFLASTDRKRHTLFGGIVARDPVMGFFFLEDFIPHGQRGYVDRDGIIQDALGGQATDQTWERALGPLAQVRTAW